MRAIHLYLLAFLVLTACGKEVRNWSRCSEDHACLPGFVCTANFDCVPIDGGAGTGGAGTGGAGAAGAAGSGGAGGPAGAGADGGATAGASADGGVDAVDAAMKCSSDDQCTDSAPLCLRDACARCTVNADCAGRVGTPVCKPDTGRCVACLQDAQCTSEAAPICNPTTFTCEACSRDEQCAAKSPTTKGCAAGKCVACSKHDHCTASPAQPACGSKNTCEPCSTDQQCAERTNLGPNPGVCMSHVDGRCASDMETIYVEDKIGCAKDLNGGTAVAPFCSAQVGVNVAKDSATKRLVVLRGQLSPGWSVSVPAGLLSVVGQRSATITPALTADGITVMRGDVFVRDLKIRGRADAGQQTGTGVVVSSESTLRMRKCTIENNPKGGLLVDRGGFDIENVIIIGNGPGELAGGLFWGGARLTPSDGKTSRLRNVTVASNQQVGLSCSSAIQTSGLIVSGNVGGQASATCGVVNCCAGEPNLAQDARLTATSQACMDKLDPTMAPSDDIDGDPRPQGALMRSDCGADEYR